MKKYSLLIFMTLFLIVCTNEETAEEPLVIEESVVSDILWTKGIASLLKNLYQIGIN